MFYWVEAQEGYNVNISGVRITELAAAFLGEYFFSNASIGDIIVHLAAGEAYHELRMRVHEPELHADWLDRRAQVFEITGLNRDLYAIARDDTRATRAPYDPV